MIRVDGGRIASNVVVGIGFLGGGAILHSGLRIKGLTTAASLWLAAAVGLAAGAGMFRMAAIVTALALFALVVLRMVERRLKTALHVHLRIETRGMVLTRQELDRLLGPAGATVIDADRAHDLAARASRWKLRIRIPSADREEAVLTALESTPGVHRVQIRHIEM